jgi:hypothetical protein
LCRKAQPECQRDGEHSGTKAPPAPAARARASRRDGRRCEHRPGAAQLDLVHAVASRPDHDGSAELAVAAHGVVLAARAQHDARSVDGGRRRDGRGVGGIDDDEARRGFQDDLDAAAKHLGAVSRLGVGDGRDAAAVDAQAAAQDAARRRRGDEHADARVVQQKPRGLAALRRALGQGFTADRGALRRREADSFARRAQQALEFERDRRRAAIPCDERDRNARGARLRRCSAARRVDDLLLETVPDQ